MTKDQICERLLALFAGRHDVFALGRPHRQKPGRLEYFPQREPLTSAHLMDHLQGRSRLGIYPLVDGQVHWFAVDFDGNKELTPDEAWAETFPAAQAQAQAFAQRGLITYIERSQSGRGAHLWGFLSRPFVAADVRRTILPMLLPSVNLDLVYPVQARPDDLGNLLALPFYGEAAKSGFSVFVDDDGLPIKLATWLDLVSVNDGDVFNSLVEASVEQAPVRGTMAISGVERKNLPLVNGFLKLISPYGCSFMRHCATNAVGLGEPMWRAALSQCSALKQGRDAAHVISAPDPRYVPDEVDYKFDRVSQKPVYTCQYIRETWPELACKDCPGHRPVDKAQGDLLALTASQAAPIERPRWGGAVTRARGRNDGLLETGTQWGIEALDRVTRLRPSELIVIGASPSIGKAQPLDAKVLTPTGWVTMGQLKVGDQVIAGDGTPTTVVGVYPQGDRDVYRVVCQDGATTECDLDHLWLTSNFTDRARKWGMKVRTLREIVRRGLSKGGTNQNKWHIPRTGPVQFSGTPLPLDPYLLGVLLGDGYIARGSVQVTNPEEDILQAVSISLPGNDTAVVRTPEDHCAKLDIRGNNTTKPGATRTALVELGLGACRAWEKFVPQSYLFSDVGSRLALLQGLFDTDATVAKGTSTVYYSTTSAQLADDVKFLSESFGARASISQREGWYVLDGVRLQGRTAYTVTCSFPHGVVPFRSKKQLLRWVPRKDRTATVVRSLESVEFSRRTACQCIAVDHPSHTYVTDDFIVTHNTAFMVDRSLAIARAGTPTVVYSCETGESALLDRYMANEAGIDSRRLRGEIGPRLSTEEIARLDAAAEFLQTLPLFVNYAATSPDIMYGQYEALFLRERFGMKQQVVTLWDYLQISSSGIRVGNSQSPYEAASLLSAQFKAFTKITERPMGVFSQLVRKAEGQTAEEMSMTEFRDSGRIEMDMDEGYILGGERTPGPVSTRFLRSVKSREGEANYTIPLVFHKATSRFEGPDDAPVPDGIGLEALPVSGPEGDRVV